VHLIGAPWHLTSWRDRWRQLVRRPQPLRARLDLHTAEWDSSDDAPAPVCRCGVGLPAVTLSSAAAT